MQVQLVGDSSNSLKHVHELLKNAKLEGNRFSSPWTREYEARMTIVASKLMFRGIHPFDEPEDGLRWRLLRGILKKLLEGGITEPTKDQFISAASAIGDGYFGLPHLQYTVLVPLWLRGEWIAKRRLIRVLSVKFKHVSWNRLGKLAGWQEFRQQSEQFLQREYGSPMRLPHWPLEFVPLIADLRCRNDREAIDVVGQSLDALRGIVNLAVGYHQWTMQGGMPNALGKCPPPPVYGVFDGNGALAEFYYTTERIHYESRHNLGSDEGRIVEQLLSRLAKSSDFINKHVTDLLLKYGQAMDTADWRSAYLSLWQVIEASVLRRDPRTSSEKVAIKRRVLGLARYPDYLADCFDMLEKWRHELVHEGRFSTDGLGRVNLLKIFVETTISALLFIGRDFDSYEALDELYCQLEADKESVLVRRRQTIEYVCRVKYRKTSPAPKSAEDNAPTQPDP